MLDPLGVSADNLVALNILKFTKSEESDSTLFTSEYSPVWSKVDYFDSVSENYNSVHFSTELPNNGRIVRKVRSAHNQITQALYDVNNDPHLLISPDKYCIPCSQDVHVLDEASSDNETSTEPPQEKLYQPFEVKINPEVSLLCDFHAHLSTAEVIGFLAGYWDADNKILYVQSSFPCTAINREDNGATDVELDPAAELLVRDAVAKLGLVIVGWYHSHPRFRPDPSITDIMNQQQYQHLLRDINTGIDPFVGLIISTFDQKLPDSKSLHQWFHVIPQYLEKLKNLNLRGGACCPIYIPMQIQATIRERKKIKLEVSPDLQSGKVRSMNAMRHYCSYKHNDELLFQQIEKSLLYNYSNTTVIDCNSMESDFPPKQQIIIDLIDHAATTTSPTSGVEATSPLSTTTVYEEETRPDSITQDTSNNTTPVTIPSQPRPPPSLITTTSIPIPVTETMEEILPKKRNVILPKHFSDYSIDGNTSDIFEQKVNNKNKTNNNTINGTTKLLMKAEAVPTNKKVILSPGGAVAAPVTVAVVTTTAATATATRSGRVPKKKQYSDCVDFPESFKKKGTVAVAASPLSSTPSPTPSTGAAGSNLTTTKSKHEMSPRLTEIIKKKRKTGNETNLPESVAVNNNNNLDKNDIIHVTDTPPPTPPNISTPSEMTLNEYLGGGSSSPAAVASRRLLCEILPVYRSIVIGVIGLSFFYKTFYRKVDFNSKWKGKTKKDKLFDCLMVFAKKLGIPDESDIPCFVSELTEIVTLFWNSEKK